MQGIKHSLRLKRLGIDSHQEAIIYMHPDCYICQAEGFQLPSRIQVTLGSKSVLATLNLITSNILAEDEAGLSEHAWQLLEAKEGDYIVLSHPQPLSSLGAIRGKIYDKPLSAEALNEIVNDIYAGRLTDIHISAFLTACAAGRLSQSEIINLTTAMVNIGENLRWASPLIVDKHGVGGLPGNRTTLVIVPIVAAYGMTMPKTSSRAITTPAGSADTMEVLAPVNLNLAQMRKVVEKENACIIWGGAISLSPADAMIIRVERVLDLDSEGQMVASVLSKKFAAGATHTLIEIPVGPTSKVRSYETAELLKTIFENTGKALGITVKVVFTDGSQPVGRGVGPALEARDVISVLKCEKEAPQDLRERSIILAGDILEFSPDVPKGTGQQIALEILDSGRAWKKFQAICEAQGGMFTPPRAGYRHTITAKKAGTIISINNRHLARLAKLAGAPQAKAAGLDLHMRIGLKVERDQPLFTIHSETAGVLEYALSTLTEENGIILIE